MAREVKVDGETFKVRGLTFAEMRGLHKKGIHFGELKAQQVDAAFIEAAEIIFSEKDLKRLDKIEYQKAANTILRAIFAETYGSRDEEKNSSRSGASGQTEDA